MMDYALWSGVFGWIPVAGPGIWFYVRRHKRPKHPQIDYKHINELEFELGLGHSDFGDRGVALEEHASVVADETDKVIEQIDRKLNPEKWARKDFEKKVMSPFRVPSVMGHVSHPPSWRDGMTRFEFPPGDTTYDGPHGPSCPCFDCYGSGIAPVSNDLVSELRAHTRVGGTPLKDPLAAPAVLTDRQRVKMSAYRALKEMNLPIPADLAKEVESL